MLKDGSTIKRSRCHIGRSHGREPQTWPILFLKINNVREQYNFLKMNLQDSFPLLVGSLSQFIFYGKACRPANQRIRRGEERGGGEAELVDGKGNGRDGSIRRMEPRACLNFFSSILSRK